MPLVLEKLVNMCFAIIFFPVYDVIEIELAQAFLSSRFYEQKKIFIWNEKYFSSILKGPHWSK